MFVSLLVPLFLEEGNLLEKNGYLGNGTLRDGHIDEPDFVAAEDCLGAAYGCLYKGMI